MPKPEFDKLPVDTIMEQWPETIRVFLDHRMACVGCPIGAFHTLEDAAYEYGLTLDFLEEEIRRAIARKP
jgi:hybrid cluster-associated redox disulfide protein